MVRLVYPPFSIITHFVFIPFQNLLVTTFQLKKISFSQYIDNGNRAKKECALDSGIERILQVASASSSLAARFLRLYIIRVRLRSYVFFIFFAFFEFNGEHLLVGWFWGDSTIIFKGTMIILNTEVVLCLIFIFLLNI